MCKNDNADENDELEEKMQKKEEGEELEKKVYINPGNDKEIKNKRENKTGMGKGEVREERSEADK